MGDASLRYTPTGRAWEVSAYVHNFTDGLHAAAARYSGQSHAWSEALGNPDHDASSSTGSTASSTAGRAIWR